MIVAVTRRTMTWPFISFKVMTMRFEEEDCGGVKREKERKGMSVANKSGKKREERKKKKEREEKGEL